LSAKNPYKKGGMFESTNNLLFELAKDLRRNMTEAETMLWIYLKPGINGLKFRRQHPIGTYIADFYCHKVKLIIEADGPIHDKPDIKEYDKRREKDLTLMGCHILHFSNKEIFTDVENVLEKIKAKVEELFQGLIINQNKKGPFRGLGVL
jgi:cyclase